jgi:general secretion pathway protein H
MNFGSDSRKDAGFSLLELLVVLAIVAVMTGLSMPAIARRSDNLMLRVAVRELTDSLRLTRSNAIARNSEMVLIIDVEERMFLSPAAPSRAWRRGLWLR